MKLVYTNENRLLVINAKNLLEANNIQITLKNEFSHGAAGELAPQDTWVEAWVVNEADYEYALEVLQDSLRSIDLPEWLCEHCGEINEGTFEICWNCQAPFESEVE